MNNIVERVLKKLKNHLYYDVFINHRGPDVKKHLASHLYYSLTAHGLRVFLDMEELQQGDGLNSQIERSIKSSFVHIAIFSPAYAESKWCLEELVLMLQSEKTIIPVFYGVQPSELRSENGRYAQDLWNMLKNKKVLDPQTKQENLRFDNETAEKWRTSLSQVAMIVVLGFSSNIFHCNRFGILVLWSLQISYNLSFGLMVSTISVFNNTRLLESLGKIPVFNNTIFLER